MDRKTVDYYNRKASEIAERYNSIESPLKSLIHLLFKKGDRILDIGCGSGRDTALMLGGDLDAYGVDPGDVLLTEAERIYPELSGRLFRGSLPDLPSRLPSPFDHLYMSAVIMHIPDKELHSCAIALRNLLNPGGTLVLSHCPQREGLGDDKRDESGRLFILRSSDQIASLFEGLGFRKKQLFQNRDALGREGIVWETLVLEYGGEDVFSRKK
ncbi:class I SAM-dependent methyltransferase [Spirochaeta isovalerica]|uniref:SAM-dependent methyltransferase n=1 Tax=Spirochaeta isovalerica TaxID=150 RepID=A0A841RF63_9SPIO|nr:class I SAM-dependent methyltransferase [Spirochaeta isovalerica]MBB6481857.1 SAM-dependent methyltransferase [Spirochaeta isovalerica]